MHARFAIPSSRFYVFLPILYAKVIMLHKARYGKKWGRKGEEVPTKKKKKTKKTTLLYLRSLMVIRYSPKEIFATTELYD